MSHGGRAIGVRSDGSSNANANPSKVNRHGSVLIVHEVILLLGRPHAVGTWQCRVRSWKIGVRVHHTQQPSVKTAARVVGRPGGVARVSCRPLGRARSRDARHTRAGLQGPRGSGCLARRGRRGFVAGAPRPARDDPARAAAHVRSDPEPRAQEPRCAAAETTRDPRYTAQRAAKATRRTVLCAWSVRSQNATDCRTHCLAHNTL